MKKRERSVCVRVRERDPLNGKKEGRQRAWKSHGRVTGTTLFLLCNCPLFISSPLYWFIFCQKDIKLQSVTIRFFHVHGFVVPPGK